MAQLILGSTSKYRKALLERFGFPFDCVAPQVDESLWKSRGLSPRNVCLQLAGAKAEEVVARHNEATVIGCDQVAVIDDEILDKPGSFDNAKIQLKRLAGRTHELLTAVTVLHAGQSWQHLDQSLLSMRNLKDEQIDRYLKVDKPYDCCGSYKLETLGISLFEKVETRDQTAITGLPLIALSEILNKCGWSVP